MTIERANATQYIEMNRVGAAKAFRSSSKYTRHSTVARRLATLTEGDMNVNRSARTDCSKGCSWCCHLQTDISAGEAFVIAEAVRSMPEERRTVVIDRLRDNTARLAGMSLEQRHQSRIPCALLDTETWSCSVYGSRPSACRRWHSLDAKACEKWFNNPDSKTTVPIDPVPYRIGTLMAIAHKKAIKEPSGELHAGVLMAIADDSEKRFVRGEPVFQGWKATTAAMTDEEWEETRKLNERINKRLSEMSQDTAQGV